MDIRKDVDEEEASLISSSVQETVTSTRKAKGVALVAALVGLVIVATHFYQASPDEGLVSSQSLSVISESSNADKKADHVLDDENSVAVLLADLKDHKESLDTQRDWVTERMKRVKRVKTVRALHHYYHIIGKNNLIGGPYKDQAEGQRARELVEIGLHLYDGDDWKEYMNKEKATKKPPKGKQAGVGTTASLVAQVLPPDEKFVILILAWLPIKKYPWAGPGGVGAAHTHGQATCNFKFLNVVEGAGNTFYDVEGGNSTQTDIFTDGLKHKGGCKDHDYRPLLKNPKTGRAFIPSKDLVGATSGFIQDDFGAHSIDNMNDTDIAFSIHMYYPPYPQAWAFHENKKQHGQQCKPRGAGHGHSNCHEPYERFCTTTSMKKYLDEAADWKKEHGDEHPVKWFHKLCTLAINNTLLHEKCTKHYGNWVKHVEDIVTDPTLQQ